MRREEFEGAIERAPDDVERYRVYADLLQSEGDPRGELIALMIERQDGAAVRSAIRQRIDSLLKTHEETFLGNLSYYRKQVRLVWRFGFFESARVRLDEQGQVHSGLVMDALLTEPSARYLRTLELIDFELDDRQAALAILCQAKRTTLRQLSITGTLNGGSSARSDALSLALVPLLSGASFPALRSLSLLKTEVTDRLVPLLLAAPLIKQLRYLSLAEGVLSDEGARHFDHRSLPAGLTLDLSQMRESGLSTYMQENLQYLAEHHSWTVVF